MRSAAPRIATALLFLAPLLPRAAVAGDASWTRTALASEIIEALMATPSGLLVAGSDRLGVFVSTDQGASWDTLSAGLPPGVPVYALAMDVAGYRTLAATGAGVFATGAIPPLGPASLTGAWTPLGTGIPDTVASMLVLDESVSPDTVLAGTSRGIYRSSLSSPAWTPSSDGLGALPYVSALAQAGGLLVAGTDLGVYLSTDAGHDWQPTASVRGSVLAVAADGRTHPPTLFAGTRFLLYRSRDLGASWDSLTSTLPNPLEIHRVLVDPFTAGTLYLGSVFSGRGIYQSADDGGGWAAIDGGMGSARSVVKSIARFSAGSRMLFAGTGSGVWQTTLPELSVLTPGLAVPGDTLELAGSLFGASPDSAVVLFPAQDTAAAAPGSWSDTSARCGVPAGARTGNVAVARRGGMSQGAPFAASPGLALEDAATHSREATRSLTVLALHAGWGRVDSVRVLDAFGVSSWNLGDLNKWIPAVGADSSLITWGGSADTLRAVMQFLWRSGGGPALVADTAAIPLDTTSPEVATFALHDLRDPTDTLYTDSLWVRCEHWAAGADSMEILPGSDVGSWLGRAIGVPAAYSHASLLELTPGEGTKHVDMLFFDQAGNTRQASVTITLDLTPPVVSLVDLRPLSNGTPGYSDSSVVELDHVATGADSIEVQGSDVVAWAGGPIGAYVPYVPSFASSQVTLRPGEGTRSVTVRFRDLVGHETQPYTASIVVDLTPPARADSLYLADPVSGNRALTDSLRVLLHHSGAHSDSFRVAPSADVAAWSLSTPVLGGWVASHAESASTVTFVPGSALRHVLFQEKDLAGHMVTDTLAIQVDTQGPAASLAAIRDPYTGSTDRTDSLRVRLIHVVNGADEMKLLSSSDGGGWSGGAPDAWTAPSDSSDLTLTAGDGRKNVHLVFRDPAGNQLPLNLSILLDTTAPAFLMVLHANPVFPGHYYLYVSPSESLAAPPSLAANGAPVSLDEAPGTSPPTWRAHYDVTTGGPVVFTAGGTDLSGMYGSSVTQAIAARIAPAGGSLASPDGAAMLVVPEGALGAATDLLVLQGSGGPAQGSGAPDVSYAFSPEELELARPVEVYLGIPQGHEGDAVAVSLGEAGASRGLATWRTTVGERRWYLASSARLGRFRLSASGAIPPELPHELALVGNRPNPFNPTTTIAYDLPGDGRVSLTVYDVTGRELAHPLRDEYLTPGRHELQFLGTDDHGRRLASGVYFYRLSWRGRNVMAKMVLLQ